MPSKMFFKCTTATLAITTTMLSMCVLNRAQGDKDKINYYKTELKKNISEHEFRLVEKKCNKFCRTLGAKADAYEVANQMYDCRASFNKGMILGVKKAKDSIKTSLTDSLNQITAQKCYESYQKGLIDGAKKYGERLSVVLNDTIRTAQKLK